MTIALLAVGVLLVIALFAAAGGLDRTRGRRVGRRTAVRETIVERPVRRERVVERPVATERVVEDYPPGS